MLSSSACADRSFRDFSLSSAFDQLRLGSGSSAEEPIKDSPLSPSKLPRPSTPAQARKVPYTRGPKKTPKSRSKSPSKLVPFLTRDSRTQDWDQQAHHETLERMFTDLDRKVSSNIEASSNMKESIAVYKTKSTHHLTSSFFAPALFLQVELEECALTFLFVAK